jgi:hypothetical protein
VIVREEEGGKHLLRVEGVGGECIHPDRVEMCSRTCERDQYIGSFRL